MISHELLEKMMSIEPPLWKIHAMGLTREDWTRLSEEEQRHRLKAYEDSTKPTSAPLAIAESPPTYEELWAYIFELHRLDDLIGYNPDLRSSPTRSNIGSIRADRIIRDVQEFANDLRDTKRQIEAVSNARKRADKAPGREASKARHTPSDTRD